MHKIQAMLVKRLTPPTLLAEKFIEKDPFVKDGYSLLTDSVALISAANAGLNG